MLNTKVITIYAFINVNAALTLITCNWDPSIFLLQIYRVKIVLILLTLDL